MGKRTAELTAGELKQLMATVLQGVPADLPPELVREHIGQGKRRLQAALRMLLHADLELFNEGRLIEALDRALFFAEEEVEVTWGYPHGWAMRSVESQAAILRGRFPQLPPLKYPESWQWEVPYRLDGYLIWPEPSALVPGSKHPYHDALELVLTELGKDRPFCNFKSGQLGPDRLRLLKRTTKGQWWAHHSLNFGDWNVAPFQSGWQHRGQSPRRSRAVLKTGEWGAGPYEVAIFLLTHPDRLSAWGVLGVNCIGAEYDVHGGGQFGGVVSFAFSGSAASLNLGFCDINAASKFLGSATFMNWDLT